MKKLAFCVCLFAALSASAQPARPDLDHVAYGKGPNNWLNAYLPSGNAPRPVLLWAHANGGAPKGFPKALIDSARAYNFAVISWESVPYLASAEDVDTAEGDFYTVFDWVKAHAAQYHFDTGNIFVSGASRGTVISFKGAVQKGAGVKGIYLVEAVPLRSWLVRDFSTLVQPTSPPLRMNYSAAFGSGAAHNPDKAKAIVASYQQQGIGNRVQLQAGLGKEHLYDGLCSFILGVSH